MARLSLIAFLALAFSGAASAVPRDLGAFAGILPRALQSYTNCGTNPGAILSLDVTRPALAGEDITVAVTAQAQKQILENSHAVIYVLHNGIPMWEQGIRLCQETCPIEPGPYTFAYVVSLPDHISPSEIEISTEGFSPQMEPLFCFEFSPVESP